MKPAEYWPNRPETPWRFSHEWVARDPVVAFGPARSSTLLCISSITLSSQVSDDATYFDIDLTDADGSSRELVFRVLVSGPTPLTFPFPTPLVLNRSKPWQVSVGPVTGVGLFDATLVGYQSEKRFSWLRPFGRGDR